MATEADVKAIQDLVNLYDKTGKKEYLFRAKELAELIKNEDDDEAKSIGQKVKRML